MSGQFFSGGWKTSNDQRLTVITSYELEEPKIFQITCIELVDSDNFRFNIKVDGNDIQGFLNEGGGVIVEGKKISIYQLDPGVNMGGSWSVMQEQPIESVSVSWATRHMGVPIAVCSFMQEQIFIIELPRQNAQWTSLRITISIDGKDLKEPNGNLLYFLEGSSVICRGKAAYIKAYGTSASKEPAWGSIKIMKRY